MEKTQIANKRESIADMILTEISDIYLFLPIFMGFGIGIYFALPWDITIWQALTPLALAISAIITTRKNEVSLKINILIIAITVGIFACECRVELVNAPRIDGKYENVRVEGTIVQIIESPDAKKLLLDNIEIPFFEPEATPKFIRLSLKTDISELQIGDRIEVKATLMPPPLPSMPGGFNFSEFAYFKQIGAIGYAMRSPYVLGNYDFSTSTKIINYVRKAIGDRIVASMDAREASIALALLIGDTTKIPADDLKVIRTSGIAHIIAISGLHVVITVGLIFITSRFLLSYIPWIALRYDLKKIAAALGITLSFFYLIIAGSPISAQRAFIMSSLVLFAIIIDRNSTPMRSVATAAMLILLFTPENLFSPSLQMSFAACISLIAGFFYTTQLLPSTTFGTGKIAIASHYVMGILISTLIAGSATAPFVIYHFNQFSTYSIITNIVAIPLTNFVIMPAGVLSLLLMPLHLEWISLYPMSIAISLMVDTAQKVSTLPEASIHISSYTKWGIAFITIGGLMLSVMQTRLRLIGIPIMAIGLLSNVNTIYPDLMLDANGKLFAVKANDEYYFSNKSTARFVRKTWEQALGVTDVKTIKTLDGCTKEGCDLILSGHRVAIALKELPQNFCSSSIAINLSPHESECDHEINTDTLFETGNRALYIKPSGITEESVINSIPKRIWNLVIDN